MPRTFAAYEPDWIDVNTQLTALGEDFGVLCEFTVTVERDNVISIARCRRIAGPAGVTPVAQSLSRKPIKSKPDLAVICFALAQDCWRQLDNNNGALQATPLGYSWNGRPHIARRDKRS